MKKLLLIIIYIGISISSFAQLNSSGFYRVINKGDGRYIHVADNTGKINESKLEADMKAVQLIKGFDNAVSNPETILYFDGKGGTKYDIQAQGTGIYSITGYIPEISYMAAFGAYQLYAHGFMLSGNDDLAYASDRVSYLTLDAKTRDYKLWEVVPVDAASDNYFGITPSVEIDGVFYHPFYADFAFSFYSAGMKAYYISETNAGGAKLVEITDEVIPAKTPVIIECSSANPSDNRLNILKSGGNAINDNVLKGVFFCNTSRINSKDAVTPYNKTTMRVLGKTADGKLGFIVTDAKNLAANQAYLVVPESANETMLALDPTQFASIDIPTIDSVKNVGVYSILGVKLRQDNNISDLPAGIYIVNGKKVVKR